MTLSPTVLGMRVHPTSYHAATQQILEWARDGRGGRVFVANVHMVMEAYDDHAYRAAVNRANLVTPDGMPLVWVLRRKGFAMKDRVYGPTLTLWVLEAAARLGVPVGFYGGKPEVLNALIDQVEAQFPGLRIVFRESPPFRALSDHEDQAFVEAINASGARILFVGLGCPKQEKWMDAHGEESATSVQAVMLGVGAAFDFHAGTLRQAPSWMQERGMEWIFRLAVEPRRLWKRYLKNNPRFAVLAFKELVLEKVKR